MCICKICKSSGRQGEVFLIENFENLENAICGKCIQPERSKREDLLICCCKDLEKKFLDCSGICPYCNRVIGCGALNSMET